MIVMIITTISGRSVSLIVGFRSCKVEVERIMMGLLLGETKKHSIIRIKRRFVFVGFAMSMRCTSSRRRRCSIRERRTIENGFCRFGFQPVSNLSIYVTRYKYVLTLASSSLPISRRMEVGEFLIRPESTFRNCLRPRIATRITGTSGRRRRRRHTSTR